MWTITIRLTILLAVIVAGIFVFFTAAISPSKNQELWQNLGMLALWYSPTVIVGAVCGFAFWTREWLRSGAQAGAIFSTMILAILIWWDDHIPGTNFHLWTTRDWIVFVVWFGLLITELAALTYLACAWIRGSRRADAQRGK